MLKINILIINYFFFILFSFKLKFPFDFTRNSLFFPIFIFYSIKLVCVLNYNQLNHLYFIFI